MVYFYVTFNFGGIMAKRQYIVGIGEILWDNFDGCSRLGGASANFAYHVRCQGGRSAIASAVGNDDEGKKAVAEMAAKGVETAFVQTVSDAPTGSTVVSFEDNVPQYEISDPAAWDFLRWDEQLEQLAEQTHAVAFGTLAQRTPGSREAIRRFVNSLPAKCPKVLDLNLRPGMHDKNLIVESMCMANILKLNESEMNYCRKLLSLTGAPAEGAYTMIERYQLAAVIITKGLKGVSYYDKEICFDQPNPDRDMEIVNTIGCGDAFLAAFLTARMFGHDPESSAGHAQNVAGYVAACPNAMPEIPEELQVWRAER